jgi:hypothetical protein
MDMIAENDRNVTTNEEIMKFKSVTMIHSESL